MALTPGTRLGVYEVTAQIGEGGMGQVYRATDTKLKRHVAIKILPPSLAVDHDRLARFQREAEVLASLNHPNIAAIYGLEDSGGMTALVMELVEGDDLSQRIVLGAIPLDDALPIAKQIAEALEAAHEQGIIHRDLKPANIKVRSDGVVKVLDFGLAKAMEAPGTMSPGVSQAPTITTPAMMTSIGMILGTAAYMSPEQAKGREADKRSDIWAFGAVLYEMLTGRRAFDGEDMAEVLGAVVRLEPNWEALPADVPPAVRALLRQCLVKDRRKRIADIAVGLFVLDHQASLALPLGTVSVTPLPRRPLWQHVTILMGGALVVAAVAGAASWLATWPAEPVPPRVSRLPIAFSPATALTVTGIDRDVAMTPDGSRVVYVGNSGTQLFVRALDALEPVAVFTGAPHSPFVSPDGQWIGFVDANALKKVTVTGGPAVTVAAIGVDRGATWVPDDTIIFAGGNPNTGLQRIAAAGGTPTVLTRADRAQGEVDHLWPEQLPGGRAVLFTITTMTGGLDAAQIAVLDLQTGEHTILVRGGTHAHYVPSGHLVYAAAGTLRAVPFDLTTLETRGTPVPVISDVVTTNSGAVNAAMAGNGTLAYVSGTARAVAPRTLVWVDLSGNEEALKVPARAYVYPRLSPDGTRLAVDVRDQEEDIWIVNDLARATLARFSFGPSPDRAPVWTPDGQRIVWSSARAGVSNLYWQAADGAGVIDRLTQSSNPQFASGFSPDGTRLVIREGAAASRDLMIVPMDQGVPQASRGRGEPRQSQPLLQTPFMETSAEISPNGRWIAYQSDESGQDEIYVRPFPDVETGRWQVSAVGGTKPLWARSGQELFYLVRTKAGAAVMSTPIERGASFATGIPTKAVEGPYLYGTSGSGDTAFRTYDVSVDGRRFLMVREGGGTDQAAPPTNLIVVQNWTEDLKRLVPTN